MTAVAGTFVKFDAVPTRKVVRVIIEVPIEKANSTLEALGGFPDPANAQWVGIAPLDGQPVQNTMKGGKLSQRAAMLCDEGGFRAYCEEVHNNYDPRDLILTRCNISSRAHIDHNDEAAAIFRDLCNAYDAWRMAA